MRRQRMTGFTLRVLGGLGAFGAVALFACSEDSGPGALAGGTGTMTTSSGKGGGGSVGGAGGDGAANSGGNAGPTGSGGETGSGAGGAGSGGGGPEDCYNGIDDDANMLVDCDDPSCVAACKTPCGQPNVIADPTEFVEFDNTGHPSMAQPANCASKNGGPASVYKLTTKVNGMLDIQVSSSDVDVTVSIRIKCDDLKTEFGCSEQAIDDLGTPPFEFLSVAVPDNATVYIVVEGYGASMAGKHYLYAKSRPIDCGDGILDPVEECDDGGSTKGDGCNELCKLESDEDANNNSIATADAMTKASFTGKIDPTTDIDYIAFQVPGANYSAVFQVLDQGNGACTFGTMDPVATIYGPTQTLLATNDEYNGHCPRVEKTGLGPGTHYLKVERGIFGALTFPYRADLELDECGNGTPGAAEACDDGNTINGDGCSAVCLIE
ncbi:MAG: DUF4215 domain-containing protein [Myxococcales bacterium]|nr:DUF4215 domain-containing protein [Myxococcales bacterium]